MGYFAVIDTETNWDNEVMSIGIVIADIATFEKVHKVYYIFDPAYKVGGMFSHVLSVKGVSSKDITTSRKAAMDKIISLFQKYGGQAVVCI